jgi:hypothetical protein
MAADLRRWEYGDPAMILEIRQNSTCLGCSQLVRSRWTGTTKYVCSIGQQKSSTEWTEMRRCKKYNDGVFMTSDQSAQIEELLSTWYAWQIRQSHAETLAHFYKPEDHTCRGYQTPINDDDADRGYRWADDQQAEQVQLCVDTLTPPQRAAISTSMRNKESGHSVWSSGRAGDQHDTYQEAKERLLPMLTARHLIKAQEAI